MKQKEIDLKELESKTLEVISFQKIILGYLNNIEVDINPIDLEIAIKNSIEKMEDVLKLTETHETVKES